MLAPNEKTMNDVWAMADGPVLVDFHAPRKWRALLVFGQREQKAADFLKNADQWVYWPNYCRQIACGTGHAGGRGARRPQFCSIIPGYLFLAVHIDAGDPWSIVHVTPGIHGFVRDGTGHAAALSNDDIEIIRNIEGGLNLPFDPKSAHRFKTGDRVHFVDDIYSRWPPGAVKRLAEDGRIVVNVSLLGRVVPITVYPHQIEAM